MVFSDHQLNDTQDTGRALRALAPLSWTLVWLGLLAAARPAVGQPIPLGADFQINAITTDSQANADIAAIGDHFVVVWRGAEIVGGTTRRNIQMRRVMRDGQFPAPDFKVNTYPEDQVFQEGPRVAGTSSGFVVVWYVDELASPDSHIRARRFLADGSPIGDDFGVNVSITFAAIHPDIAATAGGRFLVVWERDPVSGQAAIDGRIFLSDGTPVTNDFVISTYMTGFDIRPAVAATPSGDFIVTWAGADGSDRGIKTRRISPGGTLLSQEFVVNTITSGPQSIPKIAVNSAGEALVAWEAGFITIPQDPGSLNVWARRLDAAGAPVATEFQVAQTPGYDNFEPAVGFDNQDNAFIVWQAVPPEPAPQVLGGQVLSPDGILLPADVVVNTHTVKPAVLPAIGTLNDGTMLVTWYSRSSPGDDTSNTVVLGRLFQDLIPALAPVAPIPTLGHLGLIAFALLLALAALRVVRR